MSEFQTIVNAVQERSLVPYQARVVRGNLKRYELHDYAVFRRPTAMWAKRAGDRWIRRTEIKKRRLLARERRARRVTERGDSE